MTNDVSIEELCAFEELVVQASKEKVVLAQEFPESVGNALKNLLQKLERV